MLSTLSTADHGSILPILRSTKARLEDLKLRTSPERLPVVGNLSGIKVELVLSSKSTLAMSAEKAEKIRGSELFDAANTAATNRALRKAALLVQLRETRLSKHHDAMAHHAKTKVSTMNPTHRTIRR